MLEFESEFDDAGDATPYEFDDEEVVTSRLEEMQQNQEQMIAKVCCGKYNIPTMEWIDAYLEMYDVYYVTLLINAEQVNNQNVKIDYIPIFRGYSDPTTSWEVLVGRKAHKVKCDEKKYKVYADMKHQLSAVELEAVTFCRLRTFLQEECKDKDNLSFEDLRYIDQLLINTSINPRIDYSTVIKRLPGAVNSVYSGGKVVPVGFKEKKERKLSSDKLDPTIKNLIVDLLGQYKTPYHIYHCLKNNGYKIGKARVRKCCQELG